MHILHNQTLSPPDRSPLLKTTLTNPKTNMAKVWLITGASSGLGQEISLAALEHGDKVVATARNPAKLEDLKAKGAVTAKLDVTSSDETLAAVVEDVLRQVGQIDILVNNAGYILQGAVEEAR